MSVVSFPATEEGWVAAATWLYRQNAQQYEVITDLMVKPTIVVGAW